MTKVNFEPVQIYVDQATIEKERSMLEEYIDFINHFADELAKDDVTLDEKLFNEFSEKGHPAIYFRIMEDSKKDKSVSLLSAQVSAGAQRIAAKYSHVFVNLQDKQVKTGLDMSSVVILNGKAVPRGGVLEQITRRNTVEISTLQDLELYERLKKFADDFNELGSFIKKSFPEGENLTNTLVAGLTEAHYFMGKINSEQCYLIHSLEGEGIVVNPLYFNIQH